MKKQFLQNAERNNFISIFITYHNFGPMGQWLGLGWVGPSPAQPGNFWVEPSPRRPLYQNEFFFVAINCFERLSPIATST